MRLPLVSRTRGRIAEPSSAYIALMGFGAGAWVTITSCAEEQGAPRYSLNVTVGLQARELSESLAAIDANMWPAGGGEQSDASRETPYNPTLTSLRCVASRGV